MRTVLNSLHPIGSIMTGPDPTAAFEAVGFTDGVDVSWSQVSAGTFLQAWGNGTQVSLGGTGGNNETTLTYWNMPKHRHTFYGNNLPDHRHVLSSMGRLWLTPDTKHANYMLNSGASTNQYTNYVSAGKPSGHLSYEGTGDAWNSRPQFQVVDMWKRLL